MESSLWEVASLCLHFSPDVALRANRICNPSPADVVDSTATPADLIAKQDEVRWGNVVLVSYSRSGS